MLKLLLWIAAAQAAPSQTKPLPAAELVRYQTCQHTADCVRVDNGCCDCANGGDTIAVHRNLQNEFRALFACEKAICSQRAGDCTFREPACEKGRCVLTNKKVWGPPVKKMK